MKIKTGLAAATIGVLLAGCASTYYAGDYGHGPVAVVGYDGYYDDYYGPFVDGYWGADGGFYYRGPDHHYHRDVGGHFSRVAAQGMHPVHGRGPDNGGARPPGEKGDRG
jgi:hypothetical protein